MPFGSLRLQDVRRLLRNPEEYELTADGIQKLKWFAYALEHDGNVSLTCRHFGISRSTFLRWANRFDATDTRSLDGESRRPHTVRAPETDARAVALIRQIRMEQPLLGKEHVAEILKSRYGVVLSSSTVGRVIARHKLFFAETAAHQQKRLREEEADIPPTPTVTPAPEKEHGDAFDDPFYFPAPGVTS